MALLDCAEVPDSDDSYDFAAPLFGLIAAPCIDRPENLPHATIKLAAVDSSAGKLFSLDHLPGKRIGLLYGGNPERRDVWVRSIEPSALTPLASLKGVSWVNLSTDVRTDRGNAMRVVSMTDPMSSVVDFLDTAMIIGQLDAVVAIDSSVAHLTAAIGKPLWLAAPSMLDWRWQVAGTQSPWWPAVHVHRSKAPGDFRSAIVDIAEELAAFVR